ncbi:hypothetical protein OsJ_28517 [Oryza sativa Japonica Group]|uniref:Uncharacterized protein n=1 Tax=Oryza sativa subsp. japonica TaxID=39947 RepID=Q6K479_ORYSJ|nr:hypothetical protein OsJ_28517 [Oryza sativa Japonica Group]BAD19906.1 hypothetical protein [Oryza sativa Japonica Group]
MSLAIRSTNAESNLEMHPWKICEMGTADRLVGFIDIDPSVLHNLDDQESSGSNSPCEVNVIERVVEDIHEEGEIRFGDEPRAPVPPREPVEPVRTPAKHFTVRGQLSTEPNQPRKVLLEIPDNIPMTE